MQFRLPDRHQRAGLRGPHRGRQVRGGRRDHSPRESAALDLRPGLLPSLRNPVQSRPGRPAVEHPRTETIRARTGRSNEAASGQVSNLPAASAGAPRPRLPKAGNPWPSSGPGRAGFAAAHSLALAGHKVTVFESLPVLGGMLAWASPITASRRRSSIAIWTDLASSA